MSDLLFASLLFLGLALAVLLLHKLVAGFFGIVAVGALVGAGYEWRLARRKAKAKP